MTTYAETITPAKKADIRTLLKVVGASQTCEQMGSLTVQTLRRSLRSCSNCTQQTFDIIERETLSLFRAHTNDVDGPMDRMIAVYHQHFSQAEIQQLIAFYETPLGKRMLAEAPLISKEVLAINQRWAESLGPELDSRLKAALSKAKLPIPAVPQTPAAQ